MHDYLIDILLDAFSRQVHGIQYCLCWYAALDTNVSIGALTCLCYGASKKTLSFTLQEELATKAV